MDREEAKRRQEERSRRYGIGIKPDGNVTIPAEHSRRWPDIADEDYLDPVNYRYPCPNAEQTRVAARYWGQPDNQAQYTEREREIITRRLEEKKKKFKIGEYAEDEDRANKLVVLAAGVATDVPEFIQVLPYGRVRSEKGEFLVDEESVREIMAWWAGRQNDLVIDYEHQTLAGVEAPAAGWVKELEDRGPQGIWARVEWTPRARRYLANREYRYLSPVVAVRKSDGRVVRIHSIGLTNAPAIDGMEPIVNKNCRGEEKGLRTVAEILGLEPQASEEQVAAAVRDLRNRAESVARRDVLELLELEPGATLDQVKGKILALKNPSGYVRVEEFNALKEKLALKERDELVEAALKAGKIAPAQKAWAEQYALKDPAGFRAFLDQAPQVVPVDRDVSGLDRPGASAKPDEVQTMVNKMLGVSEEDFKKYGTEV